MTARPRPQIVTLTDAAAGRVKDIMASSEGDVAGVRIGIEKGGCAGMAYTMDYVAEADPLDEVVDDKGVKLFIDAKAVLFLLGTEMDFQRDKLSAKFVFQNPNEISACGCGESVTLSPSAEFVPGDPGPRA